MKRLSVLALFAVLVLASCTKEEILKEEIIPEVVDPEKTEVNGLLTRSVSDVDGLNMGCVSIDYPFEMILLDSSTVDIASEEDFIDAISDPANFAFDFVYPLSVTDEDDIHTTVNSADELAELFVNCIPDIGWDDDFEEWFFPAWEISYETSCYQMVYPVTLLNIDSMSVSVANEDELIEILADGNIYSFAFPLTLEDEDGNSVTVSDPEEFFDLLSDCYPDPGPGGCGIGTFGCFELGYPLSLELIDGSIVVVNDDDEFVNVLLSGDWAGFVYPLTLIGEAGNEVLVNSEEELNEALLDCTGIDDPGLEGDLICYDFDYPIQIDDPIQGASVTINDTYEWNEYLVGGGIPIGFVYPIVLIHIETEETTEVRNDDELFEALNECW